MTDTVARTASKVPEVTLVFWIIKIAATTLGETGGDTVTMTLNWGYLAGTLLFLSAFARARRSPDRGEKISSMALLGDDHCDHDSRNDDGRFRRSSSLGIGYAGGATAFICWAASGPFSVSWYRTQGFYFRRDSEHAEDRDLLLGGHHRLANTRYGARRLDGRHLGSWLCWRGACLRRGVGGAAIGLYFGEGSHVFSVLGRLHPDAAARRDGRRDFLDKPGRTLVASPSAVRSPRRSWRSFIIACILTLRSGRADIRAKPRRWRSGGVFRSLAAGTCVPRKQ